MHGFIAIGLCVYLSLGHRSQNFILTRMHDGNVSSPGKQYTFGDRPMEKIPKVSERQRELILQICQEIDSLVTQDPNAGKMEVLEAGRFRMNDLLMNEEYEEALEVAYSLSLYHAGGCDEQSFLDSLSN